MSQTNPCLLDEEAALQRTAFPSSITDNANSFEPYWLMWASQATAWLTAGVLLLLFGYHEYSWFAAFQEPRIFQHRFAGSQKDPDCTGTSCYRYYNSKSAPFLIEAWPDVGWNTGEFYSGSIPVDESDPSRTLFFIFKPTANRLINGEVVVWLNGGPGCSSLYGFASENGPIAFQTDDSPDSNHAKNAA